MKTMARASECTSWHSVSSSVLPPGPCEAASRSEPSATKAPTARHPGARTPWHDYAAPPSREPICSWPVEQHRPVDEGRAGYDLGRSRQPKPGGRRKWCLHGRGSGRSRRWRGVGQGPAGSAARQPRRLSQPRAPPPLRPLLRKSPPQLFISDYQVTRTV